jgi:hypothetical protein
MGFGLIIEFIRHLRCETISNSYTIIKSHCLQFTTAHKVFTICHLVTPNSQIFITFHVPHLLSLLTGGYLTTLLGIAWSQSFNKGCSSRSYSSRTALALASHLLKAPVSYDCTLHITVTSRLVFPLIVYGELLGEVFQQLLGAE